MQFAREAPTARTLRTNYKDRRAPRSCTCGLGEEAESPAELGAESLAGSAHHPGGRD